MQPRHGFISCAFLLLTAGSLAAEPATAVQAVDYVRQIKPLLSARCSTCHGVLEQKSGLRLDTVELMKKGGENGPAVVPGKSSESLLVAALAGTGNTERMPLEGTPFSDEQIALVKNWIDQGAVAPAEKALEDPARHWAFQRPARAPLPAVANKVWVKNPIDIFLSAEHEKRGLKPAEPAIQATLLRRVYLDLVGVPPSRDELLAFLADESADAYEKVVDRLLESPHYAERWGRHWMDIWRYSDWDGYKEEIRESQHHIWHWRDWILESLNADKPYDRMIVEMLAADEVAPNDANALRATGFLARNWFRFNRNVWLDSTIEHTAKGFLGLTMNCARCHAHKYDPISQADYYRFRAFFEPCNVRTDRLPGEPDIAKDGLPRMFDGDAKTETYLMVRGEEKQLDKAHPLTAGLSRVLHPGEMSVSPVQLQPENYYPGLRAFIEQEEQLRAAKERESARMALATAAQALATASREFGEAVSAQADQKSQSDKLKTIKAAEAALTLANLAFATADAQQTAVLARLAADRARFSVPAAANGSVLALAAGRAERQFELCKSVQSLCAAEQQVDALRIAGKTGDDTTKKAEKSVAAAREARDAARMVLDEPNDYYPGFSEVYPSTSTGRRTALARWIASKDNPLTARVAINHIWLRHFSSPLVPTVFDFGLNGKPPTHPALLDWLAVEFMENGWHMKPIHRLIVTSAAYRMRSTPGESSAANAAIDPENAFLWRMNSRRMESEIVRDATLAVAGQLDPQLFGPDLDPATGLKVPRRSIYFRSSKEKTVTFLALFDSPNVVDCYRRSESIVPQQALAMANSPLTLAEARVLAAKITTEVGREATPEIIRAFIQAAFEHVLSRSATPAEQVECADFLRQQTERFAQPAKLSSFTAPVETTVKPSTDAHQRAREDLIHVLLNHNDFVTVR